MQTPIVSDDFKVTAIDPLDVQPPREDAGATISSWVRPSALQRDDFLRIGVSERETRSAVIRSAASRTAKSLVADSGSGGSAASEEAISRLALSTYRLLDPRQRADDHSRAHLGRIRAGVLLSAQRAAFADAQRAASAKDQRAASAETQCVANSSATASADPDSSTPVRSLSPTPEGLAAVSRGLRERPGNGGPKAKKRLRVRLRHPLVLITMMVALLAAAIALSVWSQAHDQSVRIILDRYSRVDG